MMNVADTRARCAQQTNDNDSQASEQAEHLAHNAGRGISLFRPMPSSFIFWAKTRRGCAARKIGGVHGDQLTATIGGP